MVLLQLYPNKKVNHLLRCVNPNTLANYIDLVDALLRKVFQHIIGVTVTDHIWRQVKTSAGVGWFRYCGH